MATSWEGRTYEKFHECTSWDHHKFLDRAGQGWVLPWRGSKESISIPWRHREDWKFKKLALLRKQEVWATLRCPREGPLSMGEWAVLSTRFWQVTHCREIMGFNSILIVMETVMVHPFAVLFFYFWYIIGGLFMGFSTQAWRLSLFCVCEYGSGMPSKELLIPSP